MSWLTHQNERPVKPSLSAMAAVDNDKADCSFIVAFISFDIRTGSNTHDEADQGDQTDKKMTEEGTNIDKALNSNRWQKNQSNPKRNPKN